MWTKEEIAILKRYAPKVGFPRTAAMLGRPTNAVRAYASRHGIKGIPQREWIRSMSEEDRQDRAERIADTLRVYETEEDRQAAVRSNYRLRYKAFWLEVYGLLGEACVTCGESDPMVLQVDHVEGGGHAHRKEMHGDWRKLIEEIRKVPDRFQLLCANCHQRKRREAWWPADT